MLSLIMQRCLDRSVQCYFSTHYSVLQLNPSNQRWCCCLLDTQVSVYSRGRTLSMAAIGLFTEPDLETLEKRRVSISPADLYLSSSRLFCYGIASNFQARVSLDIQSNQQVKVPASSCLCIILSGKGSLWRAVRSNTNNNLLPWAEHRLLLH